jgi:hypothetical protein
LYSSIEDQERIANLNYTYNSNDVDAFSNIPDEKNPFI